MPPETFYVVGREGPLYDGELERARACIDELRGAGYEVLLAANGPAGLKMAEHEGPDLVFLDIKMPRMDGMELLRRLRLKTDMPVIFLTSKDEEIDELIGLAQEVLEIESRAVDQLRSRLNSDFADACQLIMATPGRVVVTGIGKSGHVSSKIAATLASKGVEVIGVDLNGYQLEDAAIDYLDDLSWDEIQAHESLLLERTQSELKQMPEVRLVGEPVNRAGAMFFR